jgi:hypothetical protein
MPSRGGAPPTGTEDPGLDLIVRAWPDLPPAVRAGIVAMVRAAKDGGKRPESEGNPDQQRSSRSAETGPDQDARDEPIAPRG